MEDLFIVAVVSLVVVAFILFVDDHKAFDEGVSEDDYDCDYGED